jgi:hypothetical protein
MVLSVSGMALANGNWDVEVNIQQHLYILFFKEDFILVLLLISSEIKTTYLITEISYNPLFLYHSRDFKFLTVITQSHCITYSSTIKSYSYDHSQVPKKLSFIFPCAFGSSKFPCESFAWLYIFTSVCRVPCLLTKMCRPFVLFLFFSNTLCLSYLCCRVKTSQTKLHSKYFSTEQLVTLFYVFKYLHFFLFVYLI